MDNVVYTLTSYTTADNGYYTLHYSDVFKTKKDAIEQMQKEIDDTIESYSNIEYKKKDYDALDRHERTVLYKTNTELCGTTYKTLYTKYWIVQSAIVK